MPIPCCWQRCPRSDLANDGTHRIKRGYQRMTAYSGFVVGDRDARRHTPAKLAWLASVTIIADRLGTPETTAIVHPRKFTSAIMSAAQRHGAEQRAGQVTGIVWSAAIHARVDEEMNRMDVPRAKFAI
jgi:FAD dependent oxidoreductase